MRAIASSTTAESANVQRWRSGTAAWPSAQMSGDRGGSAVAVEDGGPAAASSGAPGR